MASSESTHRRRLERDRRLEPICDRFEAELRSGSTPSIEEYLDGAEDADRPVLFRNLLELELAWARDVPIRDSYVERFPSWASLVDEVFRDAVARVIPLRDGIGDAREDRPERPDVELSYRRLRQHGTGGQGIVYVAFDEELEREVALKEVRPDRVHDPDVVKRFELEAKITGSLEHPGVVPVHVARLRGEGIPFFVSKFIEGTTLHEEIAGLHEHPVWGAGAGDRHVAFQRLLRRFLAVCDTVAYAHSRRIVHRDLKPANVLLGSFGETYVADWGLAKPFDAAAAGPGGRDVPPRSCWERGDLTGHGDAIGTPVYASPEQARGEHHLVDARSDVYGLGATLYELVTGLAPFDPSLPLERVRALVARGGFERPRKVRPGVPRALEAVCLRCMALEPAARYASVSELAADLERWLAGEPVAAYREPWPARVARWLGRHRGVAAGLSLLVAATIGAGAWWVAARQARHDETRRLLERHEQFQLVEVVGLSRRLRADRAYALGEIDRRLAGEDLPGPTERLVRLLRLGVDGAAGDDVVRDLERSPEWTASVVNGILARPPVDVAEAAGLREILRPAAAPVVEELRAILRGMRGEASDEVLDRAGTSLLAYLEDEPGALAESIPDLPEAVLGQAIERLRRGRPEEALARLQALLDEPMYGWPDQPPAPEWRAVPDHVVRAIEGGGGFVHPHVVIVQAIELGRWRPLVDELRPCGYRPYRVRPYRARDGRWLAACLWARDGLDTQVEQDLGADSFRARDRDCRARGLALVDVAGHASGPAGELRYAGIWSAPTSPLLEGWARRNRLHFQSGSSHWPWRGAVVSSELGLTPGEAEARLRDDWPQPDWVPWTFQLATAPDGSLRATRSWTLIRDMDTSVLPTLDGPAGYEDRLYHGLIPRDVAVATSGGGPGAGGTWFAATWGMPSGLELRELHGLDPAEHLARARELAAQGFRPAGIGVASGPDRDIAVSAWHRPADVGQFRCVRAGREARIVAALHRLGDGRALWSICRRGPDPATRYLLADRAPGLGLTADELLDRLREERDPGVAETLLLALGSFDREGLASSGIRDALTLLQRLGSGDDPGVASAARWLAWRLRDQKVAGGPPPGSAAGRRTRLTPQGRGMAVVEGPVPFDMGESRRYAGESEGMESRHRVRIPRSFAIGTTEVTVEDYRSFLRAEGRPPGEDGGTGPGPWEQPDVPVTGLPLVEVARYANWLGRLEGLPEDQLCFVVAGGDVRMAPDYLERSGYRLPTEAEWEFACRAGTTTPRPFGRSLNSPDPMIGRYAWHPMNATGRVHPVGEKWPNALGLFDVLGNARELCLNAYAPYCEGACHHVKDDLAEFRGPIPPSLATRGGSFAIPEFGHLSSHRLASDRVRVPDDVGFRLARTIPRANP